MSSDSEVNEISVPELLQRSDAIQLGKEWDYVQNTYSTLSKNVERKINAVESRVQLSQLFIKEARVTGEHGHYYPAALQMIDEVLNDEALTEDMKFIALMTKAGVQLSLHEFSDALQIGNQAALMNPSNAQIHGVLIDANVELGNYEKAVALSDRMISLKPDIRSYSRVSYLREIHGDVEGSMEAMKMAVESGYPGYEETAWAALTLGDLLTEYGRWNEAEKVYKDILQMRENYPFAVGALANIYHKKGELEKSERTYLQAMEIIPEVGFYIGLAELYKEIGREDEMDGLVKEILVMLEDDVDSGHNMNLEYAHVYLDILEDFEKAEEYVSKEYAKRPENIDVNLMMAKVSKAKEDESRLKDYLIKASVTNSQNPELLALLQ